MSPFSRIVYSNLNSRQQENYNFHKLAAVLADHGFTSIRLSDDWQGADFIALHISGEFLRVQLKSRLSFDKKYLGKDLQVAFRDGIDWYMYPHDELCEEVIHGHPSRSSSRSWDSEGIYNFPTLGKEVKANLVPYLIRSD